MKLKLFIQDTQWSQYLVGLRDVTMTAKLFAKVEHVRIDINNLFSRRGHFSEALLTHTDVTRSYEWSTFCNTNLTDTYLYSKSTCKRSDNMSGMKLLRQLRGLPSQTFSISKCACYVSTVQEARKILAQRAVKTYLLGVNHFGWSLLCNTLLYLLLRGSVTSSSKVLPYSDYTKAKKCIIYIFFWRLFFHPAFENILCIPYFPCFRIFHIFHIAEYSVYSAILPFLHIGSPPIAQYSPYLFYFFLLIKEGSFRIWRKYA